MKSIPAKFFTLALTLTLGLSLSTHTARADKETELGGKMKIIGKSVKQLRNQIADPAQQQSSISLVEDALKAAQDAKKLAPAKAANVPEADRAKFITDYQAQMDVLIKDLTAIEDALKAGKYDDAQKAYAGLGDVKKDGHGKFIDKKD